MRPAHVEGPLSHAAGEQDTVPLGEAQGPAAPEGSLLACVNPDILVGPCRHQRLGSDCPVPRGHAVLAWSPRSPRTLATLLEDEGLGQQAGNGRRE